MKDVHKFQVSESRVFGKMSRPKKNEISK